MNHVSRFAMLAGSAALTAAPRAITAAGVRADVDPVALIGQINAAVTEMRAKQDALSAKVDPLDLAQIEAMNTSIGEMQATLDKINLAMAAKELGGTDSREATPEERKYRAAFDAFVRGDETKEAEVRAAHKGDGIKASITRGTEADGGYFAPVEWDRTIQKAMLEVSPIRQLATVTSTSKAGWKELYSDEAWGSGWVGETAARPNTATPTLDEYVYSIGEIYANPLASQTILDDSEVDIEDWIAEGVQEKFNLQEGIAFLSGDGVNKPRGLLTYGTGDVHPRGNVRTINTGHASQIQADELLTLIYGLKGRYRGNARFLMNTNTMANIRKLKDGQDNYIWAPGLVAGQPATILGYPVTDVPDMPDVGAGTVPIVFGDIRAGYRVIDRIGIRVLRDPYSNKPYVQFYTTKRVGGGLKDPEALIYHKVAVNA